MKAGTRIEGNKMDARRGEMMSAALAILHVASAIRCEPIRLRELAIRPIAPEECRHVRMPSPLRPGERRRPRLIVRKIRRGSAREEKGRDL